MTSTLYKRLKVDNGIKIYHYTGVCVRQIEVKELYQAAWQPLPTDLFPERISLSPPPGNLCFFKKIAGIKPATPKVSAGKYRPPGARGNDNASSKPFFDREALEKNASIAKMPSQTFKPRTPNVPGYVPGAKQNGKQAKGKGKAPVVESNGLANSTVFESKVVGTVSGGVIETEKKLKKLQKKLDSIQDLKTKQSQGIHLELTQIQKISTEVDLLVEIEKLKSLL